MPKVSKKTAIPDDCLPKCSTYAFVEIGQGDDAGYCRRYPPQVIADDEGTASAYPVIHVADWCDEYKRRCH